MNKRPHIIIINPDEMRADTLHHLGNAASVTPNLDDFIENDAVSFANAFCQNPVCVPSRCSFMTGLYPHTHGHRTMTYLLHPGEDHLLKELHDNGYYVIMNDRNDLCAGQIDGWVESACDEIIYGITEKRAPGAKNPKIRGEMGSPYYYSHYHGELNVDDEGKNYTADDLAIDKVIERMLNPVDERPICAFVGLFYPHVPYNVEEPYYSMIDRTLLQERIKYEDCKGKSKIIDKIKEYSSLDGLTEEEWDEIRATYLGMCTKVDDQFGRLIKALKEKGIYDDCAIFFLSDHGDFAGDYGLVEKAQNSFEDCLTRVPLLIKPPKGYAVDAGVSNALVELVDFYKTAMDFANVKPSHTDFGYSLVEQIADRTKEGREFVTCVGGREKGELHCDEFHNAKGMGANPTDDYYPKKLAQKEDDAHDKGFMIRNKEFKYISRSRTKDEFYDLCKDPNECINEIDNPIYKEKIIEMKEQLLKWLQQTCDVVPYEFDSRFTKEMTWAKVSGMVAKENEEKVREFIDTGADFMTVIRFCLSLMKR